MNNTVLNYKKKEAAKLLATVAGIEVVGIAAVLAVAAAMYAVWFYYTESDVLYLIGWYIILGSFFNLAIFSAVGEIREKIWKRRIRTIRRNARRMQRRLEHVELENC